MSGGRVAGKVAVVIGDGDGVAAAVAATLAGSGAVVVPVPSYDSEWVAAGIDRAILDEGRLDTVFCAADTPGSDTGLEHVVNVMAAVAAATPHLLAAGRGSITLAVSTAALSTDIVHVPTAITESAVITFGRATATAMGKLNVRCNIIAAGPLDTADTASLPPGYRDAIIANNLVGRLCTPADIASLALFLASDDAEYITGQVMRVDGGLLAHLPHYAFMIATGSTTTGGTATSPEGAIDKHEKETGT